MDKKEHFELSDWDCLKELYGLELHNWTLYYDETNNPVKFKLDSTKAMGVNNGDMLFYDFILGGIATRPGNVSDFTNLRNIFEIPEKEEIKSTNLFKLTKGMENLSDERASKFLKLLLDNDVLIHFCSVNSLYDAAIEIVDDSFRTDVAKQYLTLHWELKTAFYRIMSSNMNEFLEMLTKYEYPKIKKELVNEFRKDVIIFISSHNEVGAEDVRYLDLMVSNMQKSIDENSDSYYGTDKKMVIIDSYSYNYLHPLTLFPGCDHIFDNEVRAIDRFSKTEITYHNQPYSRYRFVDSKDYIEIQISDILIKIMSILFYHIDNELTEKNYLESIHNLNNNQLKCLFYLNELIERTIACNQTLIHYVLPYNLYERRNIYIEKAAQTYLCRNAW